MLKLYAQNKRLVQILFFLTILFSFSACSINLPKGIWGDTAVVSKNPDIVPDISWQTKDQRKELRNNNEALLNYKTQSEISNPVYALDKDSTSNENLSANNLDQNFTTPQNNNDPYNRNYSYPSKALDNSTSKKAEKFEYLKGSIKQEVVESIYSAESYNKVKVSILLPLSGNQSKLGQSMLNAAQMALFDVGGDNFELSPIDTKGTTDGALKAAQQAINAHTDLILGPIFSQNLKAIKYITKESNTPVISFTTDWTLADRDTYIMGFLPFTQVARVAKYAQRKGYSNMAIYAPKTKYCDVVIRTLKNSGVHISRIGRYSPNQPDLSILVKDFIDSSVEVYDPNENKKKEIIDDEFTNEKTETELRLEAIMKEITEGIDIKEKKIIAFDTLFLPVGNEGLNTLVNEFEINDIDQTKVKYLGTGLWDDPRLTRNPSLYGGWFAAPDPTMRIDFEKRFKENFGYTAFRVSSLAYDATALAAVLAQATKTNGTNPYSSAILTNPRGFTGIDGLFRFRKDGLSERGLAVLEIREGKSRVIDSAPTAFILQDEEQ